MHRAKRSQQIECSLSSKLESPTNIRFLARKKQMTGFLFFFFFGVGWGVGEGDKKKIESRRRAVKKGLLYATLL